MARNPSDSAPVSRSPSLSGRGIGPDLARRDALADLDQVPVGVTDVGDEWWRGWNKDVHGFDPADLRPEDFHAGGLVFSDPGRA